MAGIQLYPKPVRPGDLVLNVKDYGAKGDGTTDDTAAIQAAIDAATAAATADASNPRTTPVYLPAGRYMVSATINLEAFVALVAGPAYGSVHKWPQAVLNATPALTTGAIVQTPATTTFGMAIDGLGFSGQGATGALTGILVQDGYRTTIAGCFFDQFSDHAIRFNDGNACVIRHNTAQNCLLNRTRTGKSGVLHLAAACSDFWIEGGEYNASMQLTGTVSSSNLYCCAAYIAGTNHMVHSVVGEISDVGIHYAGNLGKITGCRADLNYGHGWEISNANNLFTACHAHNNSRAAANTYDGFSVTNTNNTFTSCFVSDNSGADQHRYGFNDTGSTGDSNKNHYTTCRVSRAATAKWNTSDPFSGPAIMFPDGAPKTLTGNSTAPSVAAYRFFRANNSSATSITNFTDGVAGQTIFIITNNANTTLVQGTTIKNASGANLTLVQNKVYQYINFNGVWYQVTS